MASERLHTLIKGERMIRKCEPGLLEAAQPHINFRLDQDKEAKELRCDTAQPRPRLLVLYGDGRFEFQYITHEMMNALRYHCLEGRWQNGMITDAVWSGPHYE